MKSEKSFSSQLGIFQLTFIMIVASWSAPLAIKQKVQVCEDSESLSVMFLWSDLSLTVRKYQFQ